MELSSKVITHIPSTATTAVLQNAALWTIGRGGAAAGTSGVGSVVAAAADMLAHSNVAVKAAVATSATAAAAVQIAHGGAFSKKTSPQEKILGIIPVTPEGKAAFFMAVAMGKSPTAAPILCGCHRRSIFI